MKNNLKAIIFDLDGVVTDTAEYHYKSWKTSLKEEGINFTKKDNEKLRGLSRRDSVKTIAQTKDIYFSKQKEDEIMYKKNNYYQEIIVDLDKEDMIDGIYEILLELKNEGYKMAVASASRNAKQVIKSLELDDFFEVIADGNSVNKSKPAPDLFLFTAKEMGFKPEKCLVIEDSKAGVKGAKKAGMKVVGIGPKERIGEADYCYKKVCHINLKEIL
ncbi:MAG: beta-phosphoglucomutase [Bacillota bacterium]